MSAGVHRHTCMLVCTRHPCNIHVCSHVPRGQSYFKSEGDKDILMWTWEMTQGVIEHEDIQLFCEQQKKNVLIQTRKTKAGDPRLVFKQASGLTGICHPSIWVCAVRLNIQLLPKMHTPIHILYHSPLIVFRIP